MDVVVAPWIGHWDEKKHRMCIYSIHVHPSGEILATGGLDTKIRIWNTAPILRPVEEEDKSVHKLLSTLALHNGAVLCVRFSNMDGKYLASGSDGDNVILIWERDVTTDAYHGKVFGSNETNHESWRSTKRLVGHQSDVVDLAWSPDNTMLASCALDCTVIVWDTENFEQLRKLEGHHGFVKGLTWDPVGKFLASQADDRSVIVWNTSDWTIARQLFSRFEKSLGQSFFKRLSWSPEGSQICAVHAVDQSQIISTASIISRDNWKEDACLVGHPGIIECAQYNPHMFSTNDDQDPYCICMVGSQDGDISFWTNKSARAPIVVESLFGNTVFDVCWSPDGQSAFACSADGTVAAFVFQPGALGRPSLSSQTESLMAKYGFRRNKIKELPESVSQLVMEEQAQAQLAKRAQEKPESVPAENRLTALMSGQDVHSGFEAQRQVAPATPGPSQNLTVGADGKKRVQPMSVHTPTAVSEQRTSFTKDGKRRIQPMFVQSSTMESNLSSATKRSAPETDTMREELELKRRFMKHIATKETERMDSRIVKLDVPRLRPTFITTLNGGRKLEVENDLNPAHKVKFAKIKCLYNQMESWLDFVPKSVLYLVHRDNLIIAVTTDTYVHFLQATSGRRVYPRIKMDGRPSLLKVQFDRLLAVSEYGRVWMWRLGGSTLECIVRGVSIAPLVCEKQVSCNTVSSPKVEITAKGDDDTRIRTLNAIAVDPKGFPLLAFDDRSLFSYDVCSESWIPLRNVDELASVSPYYQGEAYSRLQEEKMTQKNTIGVVGGVGLHGWWDGSKVLQHLLTGATNKDIQARMSLSYLEDLMATAVVFNDAQLYRQIMRSYVLRLCDLGDAARAEDLCASLSSSPASVIDMTSSLNVLGIHRQELLDEVLSLLAQNRRFQRTIAAYQTHRPIDLMSNLASR